MTICTQKSDVVAVGFPVLEPTTPRPAGLEFLDLPRPVNVVDIKRAVVVKPARDALAAERGDDREFALPVARGIVDATAVFVPVRLAAIVRAKSVRAFFAAVGAWLVGTPSGRQVALLPAIKAGAVAHAVGVPLIRTAAMSAGAWNRFLCHAVKVSHCEVWPKYFDIACKRIDEAYRQPRLFKDEAPKMKQEALAL